MKKTIVEIYALAVCFIATASFVISLGFALWNIVEMIAPEFTLEPYRYEHHQSDARMQSYKLALVSERRGALQGIFQKLIVLIIAALAFAIHWRIAGRARQD